LASTALLAIALMPAIGAAQEFKDLQSNGNLHLKGYGSFFIDGTQHTLTPPVGTGLSMINQMYVQYLLPRLKITSSGP